MSAVLGLLLGACAAGDDEAFEDEELESSESEIATAETTLGSVPTWVHFTNPVANGGEDRAILNEIIRLLDATPAGATVRGNVFSISVKEVLDAYARAKARGVKFQITHSGHDPKSAGPARLHEILGDGHKFCGRGDPDESNGCISTASGSIAHIKFFTFSETRDPKGVRRTNVSWWSSANQTVGSGAKPFNDAITVYGDPKLSEALNAHADNMWGEQRYSSNDYYDSASARGYVHSSATKTSFYMSPEQDTDLWDARLNDITPDEKCRVRVMHASIRDSRLALVNRLVGLKRGGCKVWIAAETVEPIALAALRRAKIPIRKQLVHDKAVMHHSRMSGGSDHRYFVLAGSHNWSGSALRKYDELLSRTESRALYDAFVAHFKDAYDTGKAPQ